MGLRGALGIAGGGGRVIWVLILLLLGAGGSGRDRYRLQLRRAGRGLAGRRRGRRALRKGRGQLGGPAHRCPIARHRFPEHRGRDGPR